MEILVVSVCVLQMVAVSSARNIGYYYPPAAALQASPACPEPKCGSGFSLNQYCKCVRAEDSTCEPGFSIDFDYQPGQQRCVCRQMSDPTCDPMFHLNSKACQCKPTGAAPPCRKDCSPSCPGDAAMVGCQCVGTAQRVCSGEGTLIEDGCSCIVTEPPTCSSADSNCILNEITCKCI